MFKSAFKKISRQWWYAIIFAIGAGVVSVVLPLLIERYWPRS